MNPLYSKGLIFISLYPFLLAKSMKSPEIGTRPSGQPGFTGDSERFDIVFKSFKSDSNIYFCKHNFHRIIFMYIY